MTTYSPAFIPGPEIAQLPPPEPPAHTSLGSTALYRRNVANHLALTEDVVAHPWDGDPRLNAEVPAEGYVDPAALVERQETVALIDQHYSTLLSPDFYKKFGLPQDEPMSSIVGRMQKRNPDGDFTVPSTTYLELLGDLQTIHTAEAEKFMKERLPWYKQDYFDRLHASGLGYMADTFSSRIQNAKIIYDDGFDTLFRGGNARTEFDYSGYRIIVGPCVNTEQGTVFHEFNHLWQGNPGLYEAFKDVPNVISVLHEAVASHVELYLTRGGDIQDIHPDAPLRDDSSYDLFRNVLDFLSNAGEKQIPIHQTVKAVGAEGSDESPRSLRQAVNESFADHPEFLTKLNGILERLQPAENVIDPVVEQEITDFLQQGRAYYQIKKYNATFAGKLRRVLGWTKR